MPKGQYDRKKKNMPEPRVDSENGFMPEPVSDPNYIPWIKPHNMRKAAGKLELVKVLNESSEYSDVVLLVRTERGKLFRLGLRVFSQEYIDLSKRFGNKQNDWHGELDFVIDSSRGYVSVR